MGRSAPPAGLGSGAACPELGLWAGAHARRGRPQPAAHVSAGDLLYTKASPLGRAAAAVRDLKENPELLGELFVQKWKKIPSLEEAWRQKQPTS